MPTIAPLENVNFRTPREQIPASHYNAIVRQAQRYHSPECREVDSPYDNGNDCRYFPYGRIFTEASVAIEPYSIFSLDNADNKPHLPNQPYAVVKAYVAGQGHFTQGNQHIRNGAKVLAQTIGFNIPILLRYKTGFTPAVGDEIGPVAGELTLDQGESGYLVISDPDTVNERVWVVRLSIAGQVYPRIVDTTLTADMCGGTPSVSATGFLLPTRSSIDISSATLLNTMNRRGENGDLVRFIEYDSTASPVEWDVLNVEQKAMCSVIDLEDSDECVRFTSLKHAGEWCGTDEPTVKCKLFDWYDCDGVAIGSCDLSLTFDPIAGCC